ncbi:hypothetical protein SNEBB_008654 [Seison nebaliae]|nr:hypothetical protein SNEBB_008654 [Seison nebaliae]
MHQHLKMIEKNLTIVFVIYSLFSFLFYEFQLNSVPMESLKLILSHNPPIGNNTKWCNHFPSEKIIDVNNQQKTIKKQLMVNCEPKQRTIVVIPYRDRKDQLDRLVPHLINLFDRQKLSDFRFIISEQIDRNPFNKGVVMNVGGIEGLKFCLNISQINFENIPSFLAKYHEQLTKCCFIFHDVDMLAENEANSYVCDYYHPRHLSPSVNELRYHLMYPDLVGGVLALNGLQLFFTNGYSNYYWGWGAEDDDMAHRIHAFNAVPQLNETHPLYIYQEILSNANYPIRPRNYIGRYFMMKHKRREHSDVRYRLVNNWRRYKNDGIKNLFMFNR